jgi:hypothetical protein
VFDPDADPEVFRPGSVVPFWPTRSPRPVPGVFEPHLPGLVGGRTLHDPAFPPPPPGTHAEIGTMPGVVLYDPVLPGLSDDEGLSL